MRVAPGAPARTALRWRTRVLVGVVFAAFALGAVVSAVWTPAPREPAYVFVRPWDSRGTALGGFHDPTGVAADAAEVYVVDPRN